MFATTWRLRYIAGYIMTEKWECIFDEEMRKLREFREFLKNHLMIQIPPLDPRYAFFGGRTGNIVTRTGNIVTRYEVMNNEKIRYIDMCSLLVHIENRCLSNQTSQCLRRE